MSYLAVVDRVGTGVLGLFEFVGALATFGARAVVEAVRPPYAPREVLGHLFQFGYRSAPLILTAGFAIILAIPVVAVLSVSYRHWLEHRGSAGLVTDLLNPAEPGESVQVSTGPQV